MVWKIKIEDLEFLPSMDMQATMAKDRAGSVISLECMITPLVSIFPFSCFLQFSVFKTGYFFYNVPGVIHHC